MYLIIYLMKWVTNRKVVQDNKLNMNEQLSSFVCYTINGPI